MGGFFANVFGIEEETEEDVIRSEAEEEEEAEESEEQRDAEQKRTVQCFQRMGTHRKLRLLSEESAAEVLPWHFEDGASYHCISFGDVDSLTYLRHIVRQQPLEYLLLSTWCMAAEDARELADWVERGFVGRVDFYVGEIFKGGYRGVKEMLQDIADGCGGRVARFRNHSKVMAGFGDRFAFAIESSANVNTNPRCEQTVITIDRGLAEFYKDFYDGINDFDGLYKDWKPYQLAGGGRRVKA